MLSNAITKDHATFRALLSAMSRPGSIHGLPQPDDTSGKNSMVITMLHSLMDNEVTCYVMDGGQDGLSFDIAMCTGGKQADCNTADFLIFPEGSSHGMLTDAKRGTLEYPDSGATVIYLVSELHDSGGEVTLQGPGINGIVRPLIRGLAPDELEMLRAVNAEFPLGVDTLFLDTAGRIMCIPRSTRIGRN